MDSGFQLWIADSQCWSPCQWTSDSGFQSLARFWILWAEFRILGFSQDSGFHKQNFPDSGIRITVNGANIHYIWKCVLAVEQRQVCSLWTQCIHTNVSALFWLEKWPRNGQSNVTHFMVSRDPVTLCRCKGRLGYRNVCFVGFWSLCHLYYSSSRQVDSSRQAFKTSGWNVCTERRRRRRRRTKEDCRRK